MIKGDLEIVLMEMNATPPSICKSAYFQVLNISCEKICGIFDFRQISKYVDQIETDFSWRQQ